MLNASAQASAAFEEWLAQLSSPRERGKVLSTALLSSTSSQPRYIDATWSVLSYLPDQVDDPPYDIYNTEGLT